MFLSMLMRGTKKHKKALVSKFCPETLRRIVGFQDKHTDSFPLYGKAEPEMYLSTWINTKVGGEKKNQQKTIASNTRTGDAFATTSATSMQEDRFRTGNAPPYNTGYGGYQDNPERQGLLQGSR